MKAFQYIFLVTCYPVTACYALILQYIKTDSKVLSQIQTDENEF